MTPLEAAKALACTSLPVDHFDDCWFCNVSQRGGAQAHDPDCPWLVMPQIAAALEALAEYADPDNWDHNEWMMPFKPELGLTGHGPAPAQRVLKPPSLPVSET